jgi:hypothetical protein
MGLILILTFFFQHSTILSFFENLKNTTGKGSIKRKEFSWANFFLRHREFNLIWVQTVSPKLFFLFIYLLLSTTEINGFAQVLRLFP